MAENVAIIITVILQTIIKGAWWSSVMCRNGGDKVYLQLKLFSFDVDSYHGDFACLCWVSPTNYSHLIIYDYTSTFLCTKISSVHTWQLHSMTRTSTATRASGARWSMTRTRRCSSSRARIKKWSILSLAFRKWNCGFLTCWYALEEHTLSFLSAALFL